MISVSELSAPLANETDGGAPDNEIVPPVVAITVDIVIGVCVAVGVAVRVDVDVGVAQPG